MSDISAPPHGTSFRIIRMPAGQYRTWFDKLGALFGLVLVTVLVASALGIKDTSDQREKRSDGRQTQLRPSWWAAANECSFDGLKAFVSVANIKTVLAQTVIVSIGALGMTMIIVSGGIDLSVGSVVALTSVLGALFLNKGYSAGTVILLTVLAGGLAGLTNGALIAGLRLMPFIVTLGMMGVARGLAKWFAGNQTVNYPIESTISGLMKMEDLDHLFPLPHGVWVAAGLAVILAL